VHQRAGALDAAGGGQQPVEVIGEGVHDREGGVDLQSAGDRRLLVDDRVEPGLVNADDPGLPGPRRLDEFASGR
jgi:hypothetical protein